MQFKSNRAVDEGSSDIIFRLLFPVITENITLWIFAKYFSRIIFMRWNGRLQWQQGLTIPGLPLTFKFWKSRLPGCQFWKSRKKNLEVWYFEGWQMDDRTMYMCTEIIALMNLSGEKQSAPLPPPPPPPPQKKKKKRKCSDTLFFFWKGTYLMYPISWTRS